MANNLNKRAPNFTMNLNPLINKGVTIANFPQLFKKLNSFEKKELQSIIREYPDHNKWVDGRANFPLRVFIKSCRPHKLALNLLNEARFSAKGVSSDFRLKLPLKINEDLAYFLGVLAGDGYMREPKMGQRGGWTIQMHEDDFEYQVNVYAPLVERLFGCLPKLYRTKRKDGRRNFYSSLNSVIAVLYLTKVFNIKSGYKVDKVTIPSFIYKNKNPRLKLAFIRGLFDTDGTVTSGVVKFSTVSRILYSQVRKILLEVGIANTVNKWLKNGRSRLLYTLRISKYSLKNFNGAIGFNHPAKRMKLERCLNSPVV